MRQTKAGYAHDWSDYRTGDFNNQQSGPATTYYRRSDVLASAKHYGHKGDKLPALNDNWNCGMTFADFIRGSVQPYRVVRN